MEDQEIEVQTKRKIQKTYKTLEGDMNEFLPQARNLFIEFIKVHDIGGERFPNFSMNTVKWCIKKSEIIFFINNDDGSLRSFIIIGVNSEWNLEYKIELLAGNEEDYPRLIKRAKTFVTTKLGMFITTLCYPSQQLYDIYEECGFKRMYNLRRKKDKSIKFVKYEFKLLTENQQFYIEELNSEQEQVYLENFDEI